jgi:hypothetical protein
VRSLYAQINRGVDQGSNPSDGVEAPEEWDLPYL